MLNKELAVKCFAYILHQGDYSEKLLSALESKSFYLPEDSALCRELKECMGRTRVAPSLPELISLLQAGEWKKAGFNSFVQESYITGLRQVYALEITENSWPEVRGIAIKSLTEDLAAYAAGASSEDISKKVSKTNSSIDSLMNISVFIHEEPTQDFMDPEYLEEYKYGLEHPDMTPRILLGYPCIDSLTGGHLPGELVVLVGQKAAGKSFTLVNIAYNILTAGKSVLFVDMEQSQAEIRRRLFSRATGLLKDEIEYPASFPRIKESILSLPGKFFYRALMPQSKIYKLQQVIEDQEAKHPVDAILVDYGELLYPNHMTEEHRLNQKASFHGLWDTAVKYGKVVISPTQATISKCERFEANSKAPMGLADIGEAKSKADFAHLILGLYQLEKDKAQDILRINVITNRKGVAPSSPFFFDRYFSRGLLQESSRNPDGGVSVASPAQASQPPVIKPVGVLPTLEGTVNTLPTGEKSRPTRGIGYN